MTIAHHGLLMGAAGGGAPTDPNFSQVVLLLKGEGANNSQTIADSSSFNRTQFATNSTAQVSTSFAKFGTGSVAVNIAGGGGGLSYADSTDFTLGTSDWTIQGFIYIPTLPSAVTYFAGQGPSNGANTGISFYLWIDSSNRINADCCSGAGDIGTIAGTTTLSAATWTYFAYGRTGSTFNLYVGTSGTATSQGTASSASSINNSSSALLLGSLGEYTNNKASVYFDEFRMTVGTYRSDIATVPTATYPTS